MNNSDQRGRLLVLNNMLLAIAYPEQPGMAHVLSKDIFQNTGTVRTGDTISFSEYRARLASEKDFTKYKIAFTPIGFGNPKRYIFQA